MFLNPIINITRKPINETLYEGMNLDKDIYFVNVADGKLMLDLTAVPGEDGSICIGDNCNLTLLGIDEDAEYPPEKRDGKLCLDPSIKIELFKRSLKPYGIAFKKLEMRSIKYFKTSEFSMESSKKEELERIIQDRFSLLFKY